MKTIFEKLNDDWNADPNSPKPEAEWSGEDLKLTFLMNSFQYPQFDDGDTGELTFHDCTRYRFGTVNDEGWGRGQCRFSGMASWGEFYAVTGDLYLKRIPDDWISRAPLVAGLNHYLFYFRDEEFECDARSWQLTIKKAEQPNQ